MHWPWFASSLLSFWTFKIWAANLGCKLWHWQSLNYAVADFAKIYLPLLLLYSCIRARQSSNSHVFGALEAILFLRGIFPKLCGRSMSSRLSNFLFQILSSFQQPEINGTVIEPPPLTILIMLDAFLLPAWLILPLHFPSSSCHAMQFNAMNNPRRRSFKCIILAPLESRPIFRLIRILPLSHLHRSTLSFLLYPYPILSQVTLAYSIFAWKCKIQRVMSSRKTRLLQFSGRQTWI